MPFPLVHNELQAAYRLVWAGFWENGFHRRIILGLFGINRARPLNPPCCAWRAPVTLLEQRNARGGVRRGV